VKTKASHALNPGSIPGQVTEKAVDCIRSFFVLSAISKQKSEPRNRFRLLQGSLFFHIKLNSFYNSLFT
ncbi:MAG: hypothetical protein ACI4OO_04860, partial [Otoolea sp.]